MVPMRYVDHALVGIPAAGDIAYHIGTLLPVKGQFHGDADGGIQRDRLEIRRLGLLDELCQVVAVVSQQPGGRTIADPSVQRAVICRISVHIHLRGAGSPYYRPSVSCPAVLMNDEHPLEPLPGSLLELVRPPPVVRHIVPIEILRVIAAQPRIIDNHQSDLVLRIVDTPEIILAVFRSHYPVSGEHQFRVLDVYPALVAGREGDIFLLPFQGHLSFGSAYPHWTGAAEPRGLDADLLEIGAVLIRSKPDLLHLPCNVADCTRRSF